MLGVASPAEVQRVGIIVGAWIVLAIVCGAAASTKKKSGLGWFFLALVISPLLTLVILAFMNPEPETSTIAEGATPGKAWQCPKCGFWNKGTATVCDKIGCKAERPASGTPPEG